MIFLVVGGGGFLGQWIVKSLLEFNERGEIKFDLIRVFDIAYRPNLIQDPKVNYITGNICVLDDLRSACKDVHTIFHTASPPEGRPRDLYMKVNVNGTRNLMNAAKENKVRYFVYTSTASVVFDGKDINNVDETTPYVTKFLDPYIETKIMAEKDVIQANENSFLTVSLRPSGIFGPNDAQAWPGLIEAGKKGQSKFMLGNGSNLMDWTYVKNLSDAHVLAALRLYESPEVVGGQAFFITNGEPIPFWDMGKYVWKNLGYPLPIFKIPAWFIIFIAMILDLIVLILKPLIALKFSITYFRAVLATKNRTFSIEKAKKLLHYEPKISMDEGLNLTLQSFIHEKKAGSKKDN